MKRFLTKANGLFLSAIVIVLYLVFDASIDLGGDNAGYYILGKALHEGFGYTNIHLPGMPPAQHFPPGYPLILSLLMTVSMKLTWLKVANGLMFTAALFLMRPLFQRMTGSAAIAWVAVGLALLNSHLLTSSTILMSEIPFLLISLLALTFLTRFTTGKQAPWQSPAFWLVVVLSLAAFHVRTAGIALVAGIGWYLLLEKRWMATGLYALSFVGLSLPWFLRGQSLGGNSYLQQLVRVNPYRPDEGLLDMGGWLTRVADNAWRYLHQEIPNGLFPQLEVAYTTEPPEGHTLIGFLLLALIIWGVVKMPQWRSLLIGYLGASFAIFLLWPDVWFGVRFMQPLIPFVGLVALVGLWDVVGRFKLSISPWWLAVVLLLQMPNVKDLQVASDTRLSPAFSNYFALAKHAGESLPADAIVLTSKPGLFYIHGMRSCLRIPSKSDPEAFLQKIDEMGITHILVDQMGYSSVGRYLVPAIQQYPNRFKVLIQLPNPETYLIEYLPAE